ncbi:MAG: T9SS type A sorting domain-containing protein, partial [Bacteroidota bacterium]
FLANVNMLTCLLTGFPLQWTFNGVPIPGATFQTLEITQDGVYSVIAKNSFGCIRESSPNYLQYTSPAGMEEMALLNAVSIYPNPATDELNFSVNEKMMGYHYQLTDCIGRTLQQGLVNETLIKLTLSDYEKGMYFLTIEGKTKKTFKVLKN